MDDSNIKRIESDFQKITKLTHDDTRELIKNLSDEAFDTQPMDYFLNVTTKFKALTLKTTNLEIFENNDSTSLKNTVRSIGSGTYGETFLGSNSGRVFKRISYEGDDLKKLNFQCRNILVESFIQSVVSSDPVHSKHVCKILQIFKEKNPSEDEIKMFDITGSNRMYYVKLTTTMPLVFEKINNLFMYAGAKIRGIYLCEEKNTYLIRITADIAEKTIDRIQEAKNKTDFLGNFTVETLPLGPYSYRNKSVSFYIELERLTATFNDSLQNDIAHKEKMFRIFYPVTIDCLTFTNKYIRPVAETLQYFNDKYKFYHGDLHTQNLMFVGDTIKIIDMGLACIQYNDKRYSGDLESGCRSSDLGIYLVSILEYYEKLLSPDTIKKLKSLLTINNRNIWNIVGDIQAKFNDTRTPDKHIVKFHIMYPWTDPWSTRWIDKEIIYLILDITPDYIMEKLDTVKKFGIAGTGGSRHNRKHRRNRTRKA